MMENTSKNAYSIYEQQYLNNSEGLFKTFPTWHGRIRRLEYGIDFIAFFTLYILVEFIQRTQDSSDSSWWFWWFISAVISFLFIIQAIKRAHDLDNSGWYILIPFYILFLLFTKGDRGINRFGSNPKRPYEEQIDELIDIEKGEDKEASSNNLKLKEQNETDIEDNQNSTDNQVQKKEENELNDSNDANIFNKPDSIKTGQYNSELELEKDTKEVREKKPLASRLLFWPLFIVLLFFGVFIPLFFASSNHLEAMPSSFLGACGFIATLGTKDVLRNFLKKCNLSNFFVFLSIYILGIGGTVLIGCCYLFLDSKGWGGILGLIISSIIACIAIIILVFLGSYLMGILSRKKEKQIDKSNIDLKEKKVQEIYTKENSNLGDSSNQLTEPGLESSKSQINQGAYLKDIEESSSSTESTNTGSDVHVTSSIKTDTNASNQKDSSSGNNNLGIKKFISGHLLRNIGVLLMLLLITIGLYYFVKPYYQKNQFDKAIALINEGKLEEAESKLKSLAESGYTEAETQYGIKMTNGELVTKDERIGVEYLKKASLKGDTLAQISLASYHYSKKDYNKAIYWAKKVQEKGNNRALACLAFAHSDRGDATKSLSYAKMIPDNYKFKEFIMGRAYATSENYAMAYYWWKKGADKNDIGCLDDLGWLYYYGYGTEEDNAVALSYFMKALSLNKEDSYALNYVGKIKFIMGNIEESKTYLQKAAELGDEDAQECFSRLELTGSIFE